MTTVASSLSVEDIARIGYEANRTYQQVTGETPDVAWSALKNTEQARAVREVGEILAGYTAERQHQKWLSDRTAAGWTYGEVKDVDRKRHPCMVPYSEMSRQEQVKDMLWAAIVNALAG